MWIQRLCGTNYRCSAYPKEIWVHLNMSAYFQIRLEKLMIHQPITLQIITFLLRQWIEISKDIRMHHLNFFHLPISFFFLFFLFNTEHSIEWVSQHQHKWISALVLVSQRSTKLQLMPVWKYSWPLCGLSYWHKGNKTFCLHSSLCS